MNKRIRKEFLVFSHNTLDWLATTSCGLRKVPLPLEKIHRKFFKIFESRGTTEAIKYLKALRAEVYQLLSWSSDGVFTDYPGIISKDLRFLRKLGKVEYQYIKLLLTLLSLSKVLRDRAVCSFDTITGPDERKFPLPLSNKDCKQFWSTLGYNPKRQPVRALNFRNYHRTSKAGPNGHALQTSMVDYKALLRTDLLSSIQSLGGPRLERYIIMLGMYFPSLKILLFNSKELVRRLIFFADKEGKTREVAILDYFSQTSLRPLHNYLFRALKKIPQDCTFDQTSYSKKLTGTEPYYSIDLTAFTDRFPVELNYKLLKAKIGSKRANAWLKIMTHPFQSDIGEIRYSVGNPMGAYSSWNSTSLAHHAIVWKACQNKKVNWKTLPYALLGDDLVIRHKQVALEYCRLIRRLGVHWSKEKTHISSHFFEFAKRVHWNEQDVTPFPVAALWSERKTGPVGSVSVYDNATDKGWFLPTDDIGEIWKRYLDYMKLPYRYRNRFSKSVKEAWLLITILRGKTSALELLPFVESVYPKVANIISKRDNAEEILLNILLNSIMLLFSESLDVFFDNKKDARPLGLVAEQLTIYLTGLEEVSPDYPIWDLPESVPHAHVWGKISEGFQKSQRRAYIIDTLKEGVWDSTLRSVLMPASDAEIYSLRRKDIMIVKTPKILKIFQSNLAQLNQYPQLI